MYAGIWTLSGMKFLMAEMMTFDSNITNVVARPMPKPLIADVVTPNVGHIPNISTNAGFSFKRP